jgi:ribosomal protein S18 acetylase RimI-like enzyme
MQYISLDEQTAFASAQNDPQGFIDSLANQPTLGSHVCNCGYIVDKNSRGQGVASAMCGHSQEEAIKSGFKAMQYNLVVSTNKSAIRLWKKHDFKVVGVLPKAFNHKDLGLVDALVMYKHLEP